MGLEACVEDIHQTIHAHPTLSEALMEAAASTLGEAVHI
jgi:dihydrolipoamide dehydrogenase